jgi:O-antigen/teichoic acid export membrane protein
MRIRTRSLIIMITQGILQAVKIIVPVILVRLITKETLGTYRQAILAYGLVSGVLSYQLGTSLFYFVPKTPIERRRMLLAQTFLGAILRAGFIAVVLIFGAGPIAAAFHNPDLVLPIRAIGLWAFGDNLAELVPAFMISIDRPVRAGVYTLVGAITRVTIIVAAFAAGTSLWAVIAWAAIVEMVVMVVGCIDMARLSPVGRWALDRDLVREQWDYSWPFWPMAVLGTFSLYFDKLVISRAFDPAVYAVYSCGAFELPVIALITSSMNSAMMPNLVTLATQGKRMEALSIWQEGTRKASLVIFPCFVFFMGAARDTMVLMYGPAYAMAAWPFVIYLCMLPIRVAVYSTLFRAFGDTKPIAISAGLSLVANVVLSLSITWLGHGSFVSFIGPSVGAAGAILTAFFYSLWRLRGLLGISLSRIMRWRELGRLLVICGVCGVVVFVGPLPRLPLVVKLAVQGIAYGVVALVAMLWTRTLSDDELGLLRLPMRTVRRWLPGGPTA